MQELETKTQIDISVNHDKSITVKTTVIIYSNGKVLTKAIDRTNYPPTHDIADLPEDAQKIAKVIWDDDAKNEWAAQFDITKGK